MDSVNIIIGGDLLPSSRNDRYFAEGNLDYLLGADLTRILANVDVRIFNLEGPITDEQSSILKDAPCLKANPTTIKGIKAINPTILGMANNHIRDYGEKGIQDTFRLLKSSGIKYVGCGQINLAHTPVIEEKNGIKIGVIAVAEHEFSIANDNQIGANPYEETGAIEAISELRSIVDYIIVLYHGGKEKYRYPTPHQMNTLHTIASAQPDLIIAQHSHCVGCVEQYRNTTIVYGQGNFHFCREDNEFYDTAVLCNVVVKKENMRIESHIDWIPIEMVNGDSIRLASKTTADRVLTAFMERSDKIQSDSFVKEEYINYCQSISYDFEKRILGKGIDGFFYRIVSKISKNKAHQFFRFVYRDDIPGLLNSYRCETHQEIMVTLFNRYYES